MQREDTIAAIEPNPPRARPRSLASADRAETLAGQRANAADGPVERLVDEAIALYRGQWILMKVTANDGDNMPAKGYVLAHSPRRADISKALAKEPPRSAVAGDAPSQPYYVFKAYPRLR